MSLWGMCEMGFKICLTSPPAILELEGLLDPSLLTDTASSHKFLMIGMSSTSNPWLSSSAYILVISLSILSQFPPVGC